jgi:endonuclease/exonuclease/phosphatase family metal-dependent hydrolase
MILQFLPDIITTNEFYASHNGNTVFFDAVMGELGEYYVCLDSPYDKGKPEAGADAISGKTINSNIIYRKDIGLEVVSSAWRYSTQKTNTSSKNPMGFIYYHGSHTAVFSYKGQNFILSTAHYADSRSSSQWAKEQLAAIADAQSAFSSPLPVILTGDLYTGRTQSSPDSAYKYLVANGYVDSQQSAPLNGNQNRSHGTFHKIGTRETNRISEDFVWCKGELQPLAFKVLVNKISDDASDHYPVMADIKFN